MPRTGGDALPDKEIRTITIDDLPRIGGTDINAVPRLGADSRVLNSVVVRANQAPTTTVTIGRPNGLTGAVSGSVTALDQGNGALRYGPELFSTVKGGLVSLGVSTGDFSYVPSDQARQRARTSADPADQTDTFVVTVADLYGRTTEAHVTVDILAAKVAPTAKAKVRPPDGNGMVSGQVKGVACDGGSLTYTLKNSSNYADSTEESAYSEKGGLVMLDQETGQFVFIPRMSSAAIPALDTDKFVVTAIDEHGGAVDVTVKPLAHLRLNVETTGTAPGIQSGRLSISTDGSNGPLRFRVGIPPRNGRVRVKNDGTYLYTRTPGLGRDIPAADRFTIVGSDHYGRSLTVATVKVCPPLSNTLWTSTAHITESSLNRVGVQTSRGQLTAHDVDGVPLRYTGGQGATVTSAMGCTVTIDAEGPFTYSTAQNAGVCHRAAAVDALAADKVDTFTVTVTNWLGRAKAVVVPVNLLPFNTAPMQVTVGGSGRSRSLRTGEWTTTVVDVDGDDFTYAVVQDNPSGTVSVRRDDQGAYVVTYTSTSAKSGLHYPSETFAIRFYDGHTASDGSPAYVTAIYTF